MTLRRGSIVTVLALLVIAAAIPWAIVDTITLLAMGIILGVVFQRVLCRAVHPGAALLVGAILIRLPDALSRGLTTRLARRLAGGV